ncbi:cyclic lactone autoinducer peptide [Paenibacillus sp. RC84]|uniref:cyclic lactone autoinducer peptide n=1 Tax=Paenibacillus sp. RC84 TaxID=3156252 RepID=UPI0035123E7D
MEVHESLQILRKEGSQLFKAIANKFNSFLKFTARRSTDTGCTFICHNPEAPEELFQK